MFKPRPAIKPYYTNFTDGKGRELHYAPILLSPVEMIKSRDLKFVLNDVWPKFSRLTGLEGTGYFISGFAGGHIMWK